MEDANSAGTTVHEIVQRVREFVDDCVREKEVRLGGSLHHVDESFRLDLQQAARDARVFGPQVAPEYGGMGLTRLEQAPVFEAAGRSLLGPLALNCAAPDEGNIHLLEVVASPEQRERYLAPLARGEIRSCFAMTEPTPGAGSDPANLTTTAEAVPGGWRISGRKWFITGANGAAFTICMARTAGVPGEAGSATMFMVDADNPGMKIVRTIDTLDEGTVGGHAEIAFDDCVVGDEAVLGEVHEGFRNAQVRLAPARLTHCMRWTGLASYALELALAHVSERRAFGSRLGELGMVQQMIADSEIDLAASRALINAAAVELDAGQSASHSTSIAKTFVAEATWRVVDRSFQMCGALAVSADVLLARYLREVRPFRIYDGPSETHRWAIARRVLRRFERASG